MEIAIGTGIYYTLNNGLAKIEKNTKIRNNYISTLHVLFTLFTAIYIYISGNQTNELYRGNTVGFFINEIMFFVNKKITVTAMTLTIHHVIMFGLLYNCSENSFIITMLVLGELTNLPGNIIYHRLQLKNTKKSCYDKELYYFQFIFYFVFRILVAPFLIFKEFSSEEGVSNILKVTMLLIYIMGIIWSVKLYKKCKILYYEKKHNTIKI
jgi:hypothetical protein